MENLPSNKQDTYAELIESTGSESTIEDAQNFTVHDAIDNAPAETIYEADDKSEEKEKRRTILKKVGAATLTAAGATLVAKYGFDQEWVQSAATSGVFGYGTGLTASGMYFRRSKK